MSDIDDENSIPAKHAQDHGDIAYWALESEKNKRIMDKAAFCPKCGGQKVEKAKDVVGWLVYCGDCYDGAEDSGPQAIAHGNSLALAVEAWNELDLAPTVTP